MAAAEDVPAPEVPAQKFFSRLLAFICLAGRADNSSVLAILSVAAARLKSLAVGFRFSDTAAVTASSVAVAISAGCRPLNSAAWETVAAKRKLLFPFPASDEHQQPG